MQPHMRVFIHVFAHQPRFGRIGADVEFFIQLAHQRLLRLFARLDLAAGKFPIPGVKAARRTLAEQIRAVVADNHGGGHRHDARHVRRPALVPLPAFATA